MALQQQLITLADLRLIVLDPLQPLCVRDSISAPQRELKHTHGDWHPSAKSGRRAVDDANNPTPSVWFDSWRRLAGLLSDENRAQLRLMRERQTRTVLDLAEWSATFRARCGTWSATD